MKSDIKAIIYGDERSVDALWMKINLDGTLARMGDKRPHRIRLTAAGQNFAGIWLHEEDIDWDHNYDFCRAWDEIEYAAEFTYELCYEFVRVLPDPHGTVVEASENNLELLRPITTVYEDFTREGETHE